jgi:4-hydroxy-2-oxoheptanedioate aldolase
MSAIIVNSFREKLSRGSALGIFMKTIDPAFVEIAGHSGLDFVVLDMEHGPAVGPFMENNIRAAWLSGILPVVRVSKLCSHLILQALDMGAAAVQIPYVSTVQDAKDAVKYAKFHPMGERGMCRFVRSAQYSSTQRDVFFESANANTLVIVQLEGERAMSELDGILEVEGIDIIFIGPYDLSQSLGLPGQTSHPKVVGTMEKIASASKKVGKIIGTFTDTPFTLERWKKAGVQYLSYSVDVGIFYEACAGLSQMHKSMN